MKRKRALHPNAFYFWLVTLFCFLCNANLILSLQAQTNKKTPITAATNQKKIPDISAHYHHDYDEYFAEAYQLHPSIPKGLLEAIAFNTTRIKHLRPESMQPSCIGLPEYFGVMGLVENGKGYFRNSLSTVAKLSGIAIADIKTSPRHNILAYAAAFSKIQQQQNITSKRMADNLSPIIALSELPAVSDENLKTDFPTNTNLYGVLYFLTDAQFQKSYQIPSYEIDQEAIFGKENYAKLSATQVDLTAENEFLVNENQNITNNEEGYQPTKKAACSMPNGPAEYASAIWDVNDSSNYSSYTVSPYTIAIHTIQGTYAGAISWFKNPAANVSIHYVIRSYDGQVTQMACHNTRCWHVNTENSYAVGLEHDGWIDEGEVWYSNALYHSAAQLCQFIASDLGINTLQTYDGAPINGLLSLSHTCHKIKGHQSFQNNTHIDPGPEWNWPYFYQLINPLPAPTIYTNASGTIYDSGGAGGNYGDEERSTYLIQPSGAATITLTFNSYDVEGGWDYLWIFDGTDDSGALIGQYSGTSPGVVTSTTGALFLEFRSDCATTRAGWDASYTSSTTPPSCVTPSGLNESNVYGIGATLSWNAVSGATGYEVDIKTNLDFGWTTHTANTNSLELAGLNDNSFYEWRVRTNCGGGAFSGYAGRNFETPQVGLTLTGGGSYTTNLCQGTFYDSGGPNGKYAHREDWSFTIAPTGANYIILNFSYLDIEANYDYLYIYDGASTNSTLVGTYTGTSAPASFTSSGGAVTIRFTSDNATYDFGWEASWTCDATAACSPSTVITPFTQWRTADFNAAFTDNDACGSGGVAESLYQVLEWQGNEWRTNVNNGFFNDEFDLASVHSDWTNSSGNWNINSNSINQSDQSDGNSNLYADLTQDNSGTYLFHWRAKMDGTGSNRRSGIHFFADDPTASNRGNSYFVYFRIDQDKTQIYDVTANSWSLETDDNTSLNANQWYDYKVTFDPISGWIRCYVDNNLVSSWQDPTPHTSGTHLSLRTGNCDALYDFMKVYKTRTNVENVSIGAAANNDVRVESSNSSEYVCRVTSLMRDNAGAWSTEAAEESKVDWTPPAAVTVNDGTGADIDNTNNSNQLDANWTASSDPNSDVVEYWYAIGTSAGATDVVNWTNNGLATTVSQTGLNLNGTDTYYFCVRAVNGAGLQSTVACSDGVGACNTNASVNALNAWYTTDFTASFVDNDCGAGTRYAFWNAQTYDGSQWRANGNAGFFYDDFDGGSVHTDWSNAVGTWNINTNAIYQGDQTQNNTNLYASVDQNSGYAYMYEWRGKIDGTGTNRRAGLHFFCDNPTGTNRGNSYFVWFRVDSDKLQFYRSTNDVFSLEQEYILTVNPNQWHDYKVIFDPSTGTIEVYRDDIFLDSWTDPNPLTAGSYISLRTGHCEAWFDDLRVCKSRIGASELVTVGPAATDAINRQSPSPTNDVGRVSGIFLNSNNNWSNAAVSTVFKVDWTPPTLSVVNDGTAADINTTSNSTQLQANWTGTDPNSGITLYEYAIGTSAGSTDVVGWTANGTTNSVTHTGLSLVSGQTYYFNIRATNSLGMVSNVLSSNGQQYQPTVVSTTALLKVYLQGAYNPSTGLMYTTLANNNRLPLVQPYNVAPFAFPYAGTESVTSMPANAVDWILVEARDASNNFTVLERRAAILLNDGTVQDIDGSPGVEFFNLGASTSVYLVVRHRNHLAILSSGTVSLPNATAYDFTQVGNITLGNTQVKDLNGSGLYGLFAGDYNANGVMSVADFNVFVVDLAQTGVYTPADGNLDDSVTISDFNFFFQNISVIGVAQVR